MHQAVRARYATSSSTAIMVGPLFRKHWLSKRGSSFSIRKVACKLYSLHALPPISAAKLSRLFGTTSENSSSQHYRFTNGSCTHVDDQEDAFIPARQLTEILLKNVSVPTLILTEIPTYVPRTALMQGNNW
jgi:hypothetical protein